ncbi:peptidoglycan DD-metalloendopeptidase family protein [Bacillus timonensis]|uniref:peptidoglycan DD-metalloendopeptidase family protein n=1 Tax=Bacillus timonensis TaxID=1033734 RepID=UPI000287E016|nr:peptidoglycan DD-metalloendopeptidase family protein [Bacillus timonensis]
MFVRRFASWAVMAALLELLFIFGHNVTAQELPAVNTEEWAWPVIGRITDTFGTRQGNHKGLDIAAPLGDHIYAVEKGIVKKSYYKGSYGHVVFIEHPNGYETVYAHLSKRIVQEGETVEKGQLIGHIGSTGNSTGPHLHFEVHNGEWNSSRNNAIDPLYMLTDKQILVPVFMQKEHAEVSKKLETYTVKAGDSLSIIASRVGLSVEEIKVLNQLTDDLIFPNQILIVEKS